MFANFSRFPGRKRIFFPGPRYERMKSFGFTALLACAALIASCKLLQKHPDYPSPEGGLYWQCAEFKETGNRVQEFINDRCVYLIVYDAEGQLDSTITYTNKGRPEHVTTFVHDPIDRSSFADTYDSTGMHLYRNYVVLDAFGNEVYSEMITYVSFNDSTWFEGDKFVRVMVPKPNAVPDTTVYRSTWVYAGRKMKSETPGHKKHALLIQGWNNTLCGIFILDDTLLIQTNRVKPLHKHDPPSDSLQVKFGNGFTNDTLSFYDPQGIMQQRYTVHHNTAGRVIAITEENCPALKDFCPPVTHYFFYDTAGNITEKREQYNCNSPVCPKTARTDSERKYDSRGNAIRFCYYTRQPAEE